MKTISAADLVAHLDVLSLVDTLADAFRSRITAPLRQHYTMPRHGEPDAVLLTMPAWSDMSTGEGEDPVIGVKLVTLVPGNSTRDVGSVLGSYVLMSGVTGEPLAVLDGTTLTHLRTAAASALASRYLSHADASKLVMVGAGAMAPHLIRAHAAIRPIREVAIWARDASKATALAASFAGETFKTSAIMDLNEAVANADIISAATMTSTPLIHGRFLKEGAHVDLVGAYTPAMRESDDDTVARARIFVDTIEGATHEAGDIVQPIKDHVIEIGDIEGDLFDLTAGRATGRMHHNEITLFKSVGTALEDLAAARLAYRRVPG